MALRPLVLALLVAATASACKSEPKVDPAEVAAKRDRDLANAKIRLRDGKIDDAEILLKNVLATDPKNAQALYGMGRVKYERSQYDESADLLQKAIAEDGNVAEFYASLGTTLAIQKKYAEAAAAFGKAFKLEGENGDYGLNWGKNLNLAKKFAEAEEALRQVAEVDVKARFVYCELGDALREQGKLDEALVTYMKAQTENPDDKMAHAGAAFVYEAKGDVKHALDEWSTYIRMDCCSDFSKDVARKKMVELKLPEGSG
ncbi:MAG: tetratricopeptide repeat protein [Nannocystaceae bacterium]